MKPSISASSDNSAVHLARRSERLTGPLTRILARVLPKKRRKTTALKTMLLVATTFTLISTAIAASPNIVVIMTDDQDDMGSLTTMPNVQEQLVQKGVRFVNSFVTTPLCGPARSSFLTGQYTHNHGVWDNIDAYPKFAVHESNSLSVWLSNAGYSTGLIGKFMNDFHSDNYVPPGWNQFDAIIAGDYIDFKLNENGPALGTTDQPITRPMFSPARRSHSSRLNPGHSSFSSPLTLLISRSCPPHAMTACSGPCRCRTDQISTSATSPTRPIGFAIFH